MTDRRTLSVCMIARNEAPRIAGAIESVVEVADEVVVVDTGSTDETIPVALSAGARVIEHEWRDDFADARNRSLAEAGCGWILCLDADERFCPESEGALRGALEGDADAYMVRIESRVDSTAGAVFVNFFPRLFRNVEGVGFEGKVHEQVTPSLERLGLVVKASDIVISHSGYDLSPREMKAKAGRNSELLLRQVKERGEDALTLFHLGEAYSMLERFEEAVESYDRALAVGKLDRVVRAALLQNKGTALVKLGAHEKALGLLKQAGEVDPGLLTVHLVMASALYRMKKFDRAEREVVSYITMCRNNRHAGRMTLGHDPDIPNALVLLAKCRLAGGKIDEARLALEDALRLDPARGDAHLLLARISFQELKFGPAAAHYEEAVRAYPGEGRLCFELARAYVAGGSTDKAVRVLEAAAEKGTDHLDLLRCLGLLRIKNKDFAGAIEVYRRILDRHPEDLESRKKLAGIYHSSGNTRLAEEVLAGA
jgi:tetratricopeptide (TPR) repeat protein